MATVPCKWASTFLSEAIPKSQSRSPCLTAFELLLWPCKLCLLVFGLLPPLGTTTSQHFHRQSLHLQQEGSPSDTMLVMARSCCNKSTTMRHTFDLMLIGARKLIFCGSGYLFSCAFAALSIKAVETAPCTVNPWDLHLNQSDELEH